MEVERDFLFVPYKVYFYNDSPLSHVDTFQVFKDGTRDEGTFCGDNVSRPLVGSHEALVQVGSFTLHLLLDLLVVDELLCVTWEVVHGRPEPFVLGVE